MQLNSTERIAIILYRAKISIPPSTLLLENAWCVCVGGGGGGDVSRAYMDLGLVGKNTLDPYHSEHQHLHGDHSSQHPLGDGCSQSVEIHFHCIPHCLGRSHHCLHQSGHVRMHLHLK